MVPFTGDEKYPLELSVLDTGDEADLRDEASQRQDNGGGSAKKEENFIVSLHGLPYSATLEDVANFLEGLHICLKCVLGIFCRDGKYPFTYLLLKFVY